LFILAGAGELPASFDTWFDRSGDLLKGFMMPGTEKLNVKGKSMVIVRIVAVVKSLKNRVVTTSVKLSTRFNRVTCG